MRAWLQKASDPKQTFDLHTSAKQPSTVSHEGYELRLLRLVPYPVSGRAIPKADYRATFEVIRGSSGPVDRQP